MLRSNSNSLGNPYSESWKRNRKGYGREDLQKSKDLSLEWKSEWVMELHPFNYTRLTALFPGLPG